MATQDSYVTVPLVEGLKQDGEAATLPSPGLIRLENGLLNKAGVVRKRSGISLKNSYLGTGVESRGIFSDRDEPVIETTHGTMVQTAIRSTGGSYYPATVSEFTLDSGTQLSHLYTFVRGDYLYVLGSDSTALYVEVRDASTGAMIRSRIQVAAGGSAEGCVMFVTTTHVAIFRPSGNSTLYYLGNVSSILAGTAVSWTTSSFVNPGVAIQRGRAVFARTPGSGFCFTTCTSASGNNAMLRLYTEAGGLSTITSTQMDISGSQIYGPMDGWFDTTANVAYIGILGSEGARFGRAVVKHYRVSAATWSNVRWLSSELHPDIYASITGTGTSPAHATVNPSPGIALGPLNVAGTERLGVWICSGSTLARTDTSIPVVVSLATTYATTLTYTSLEGQGDITGINTVDVVWNHYLGSKCFPVPGAGGWGVILRHAGRIRNTNDPSNTNYTELSQTGGSLAVFPTREVAPKIRVAARFALGEGRVLDAGTPPGAESGGVVFATVSGLVHKLQYFWFKPGIPGFSFDLVPELKSAIIDLRPPQLRRVSAGNVMCAAGVPSAWDGENDYELSTHITPVCVFDDRRPKHAGPRSTDNKIVFSYPDERGQIRRSAPSNVGFVQYPGENNGELFWTRPSFGIARGLGADRWPSENYRAELSTDPTTFRFMKIAGLVSPECPNLLYDNNIESFPGPSDPPGRLIYTHGDVLETTLPPSFVSIAYANNRLWGAANNYVWYSKPITDGEAPSFNGNLVVRIPDDGGLITALCSMDDKVVVLRERAAYVIYGSPANASGIGENLKVLRIPGDVGCPFPSSAIAFEKGVMFLSERGFYVLSRGLDLSYVGGGVEDTVRSLTISPFIHWSEHDPATQTLRFGTTGSWDLVFDYESGNWSHFSPTSGVSGATSVKGVMYYSQTGSNAAYFLADDPARGTIIDTFTQIQVRVRTGWIDLGTIQGYQRVKRVGFLLRHSRDVAAGPAYVADTDVMLYHTGTVGTAASTHTLLGSAMAGGTEFSPVQVGVKNQKCSAISVEVLEKPVVFGQANYNGTLFAMSGLTLRIGAKAGPFKANGAGRRA